MILFKFSTLSSLFCILFYVRYSVFTVQCSLLLYIYVSEWNKSHIHNYHSFIFLRRFYYSYAFCVQRKKSGEKMFKSRYYFHINIGKAYLRSCPNNHPSLNFAMEFYECKTILYAMKMKNSYFTIQTFQIFHTEFFYSDIAMS